MNAVSLLGRAAQLAERGRGEVEPNPRVGALALAGDRVVGAGWHAHYGGPHAEENALEDAAKNGARPDGIVVTLEPCSSADGGKKRRPCTELLLEAGIRRVIVGREDPDPRHGGRGLAELGGRGVRVEGPFELASLDTVLARFRLALALERPWVLAKWAMTLDGKTATVTGSSQWISGPAARDYAHELRARSEAVMVGMGTVLQDDPELTVRRVAGAHPLRVVVDPEAGLPGASRLIATVELAPVLVLARQDAEPGRIRRLESSGVEVLRIAAAPAGSGGARRIDLPAALSALRARGVRRLLVEGGGKLVWDLLAAGCLDQVAALIAPKIAGGRTAATPVMGAGIRSMGESLELDETYHKELGENLLMGGFLRAPAS